MTVICLELPYIGSYAYTLQSYQNNYQKIGSAIKKKFVLYYKPPIHDIFYETGQG
jgi:hypothetical protein